MQERPRWGLATPHASGVWLYVRADAGGLAAKRVLLVTDIRADAVRAMPLGREAHPRVVETIEADRWTYWAGPFTTEASALEALADPQYVPRWI